MKTKAFLLALILSICGGLSLGDFQDILAAEVFPSKPIEVVVGWSAGGGTDIFMRIVVDKVNQYLDNKAKMYITNKPGSSGVAGLNYAIKSKPDGYTMASLHGSNTYIAFLEPENVPYTWDNFEPLCNITNAPWFLCVREDSPFKRYEDLIQYARKNPGSVTCATAGKTSTSNVYLELLNLKEGVNIRGIPFTGSGPTTIALLGGHIDTAITTESTIVQQIRAGKARLLLLFIKAPQYPDIPTAKDVGLEVPSLLNGLAVPSGVPRDRFKILSDLFSKAMHDPDLLKKLKDSASDPFYLDGPTFKQYLLRDRTLVEKIKDKLKE